MVALLDAMRERGSSGEPAIVVSNMEDAPGLAKARSFGVETRVVSHLEYRGQGREAHDRAVAEVLDGAGADVVCLAGYMRILSPWFVEHYHTRLINVHPSLLPAFPGLHAQRQALEHGCRISGCTVHFVDAKVDHGPIIVQAAVPVLAGDDEDSLAARILEHEHQIYPLALELLCSGRLRIEARRVEIDGEQPGVVRSITSPEPPIV
jgi:phosphoribosylglycinamide formyltransferase-1